MKQQPAYTLSRCSKGATAIEFAIVLPVLLLCIFGVIEYCSILFAEATVESATNVAARQLKTAYVNGSSTTGTCPLTNGATSQSESQYIECVVQYIASGFLDKSKLQISARVFGSYSVIGGTVPTCSNSALPNACIGTTTSNNPPGCNSNTTPSCQQNFGASGSIVELTVNYPWTIMTPIISPFFPGGTLNITSSTVIQNEPASGLEIDNTLNNR
jgi:Flp pilus assembly protein TadG